MNYWHRLTSLLPLKMNLGEGNVVIVSHLSAGRSVVLTYSEVDSCFLLLNPNYLGQFDFFRD